MGTINHGTQTIIWDYKYPAKGSDFSKALKYTHKTGVYQGGTITNNGAGNAVVAPFTVIMNVDSAYCVKISTAESVLVSIGDGLTQVIYVTFSWADEVSNYMDFNLANTAGEVPANGVVLATVTKSVVNLTINYTSKTWGTYDHSTSYYKNLQTDQRILSAVATGTAPFTIASTTLNTNLNADLLDGAHTANVATASTVIVRDASGNAQTRIPISLPISIANGDIWLV